MPHAVSYTLEALVRFYSLMCRLCRAFCSSGASSFKACKASVPSCSMSNVQQSSSPDISLLSPLLQRQWHHAKNAHLGDTVVKPHTHRKMWWTCDHCPDGQPHEWEATVNNRSSGTGCPFCANKAVCPHNSLAANAPTIAAQLSDCNEGTSHQYTVSSQKSVTWQCQHGHQWNARISSRTKRGTGCPVCYNTSRKVQTRIKHPTLSDSQHPMMQYYDWDLNAEAGLDPSKIRCRSNQSSNWICCQCPKGQPHRWQATIGSMYKGSGCPCCSGHKACICNSLQSLFPEVAAEWDHSRNTGTPSDCAAGSHEKVWWYNRARGSFQAAIKSRTKAHKNPRVL